MGRGPSAPHKSEAGRKAIRERDDKRRTAVTEKIVVASNDRRRKE